MDSIPYLRTQSELLDELKIKLRTTQSSRWDGPEYYTALNEVLMTWAEHVKSPHIYTITDGWQANTYEYALPNYVRPPIRAELLRRIPYFEHSIESATSTWQEVPGYELEPDGEGGQTLRLFAPPRTIEGRVIFYAPNSRVPTTIPTTSGEITSSATSVVIGSAIDVDDVGFVKINAEWMSYQGVTRGSGSTTLTNLTRGLYGTTAATQATSSNVTWGIGADTLTLYAHLFDGWKAYLHAYYLQDGGTHEISRHEKALGLYEQKMANFFATYSPQRRRGGLKLNRKIFSMMR